MLNITYLNLLENFGFDKVNYRVSLVVTSKEQYILEIVTGFPSFLLCSAIIMFIDRCFVSDLFFINRYEYTIQVCFKVIFKIHQYHNIMYVEK